MNLTNHSATKLIFIIPLLLLALGGCSQDDVAAPADEQILVIQDPLDDVLKSTDGATPTAPQDRLARLADVLGLDETQLAELTLAYTEFRDGVAELRAQCQAGELTREEARAAVAILREAFEAELQIILTAEQYDLLQEMRLNHPRPPHNHSSPHERWTEWLTEIGADETQITAVFAALTEFRTEVRDLRAEVREGTITREEAREATAVLRVEFDEALQGILTEEQYAALMELRPDCGGR